MVQPTNQLLVVSRSTVTVQVLRTDLPGCHKAKVCFVTNQHPASVFYKLHQGNDAILHELSRHGSTRQMREPLTTECHVLPHLNNAKFILASFCLHWNHVLNPPAIHTKVQLINLNLTHVLYLSSQMALE